MKFLSDLFAWLRCVVSVSILVGLIFSVSLFLIGPAVSLIMNNVPFAFPSSAKVIRLIIISLVYGVVLGSGLWWVRKINR